jgi:Uncharacterized protein conserved in bacteria
MYVNRYLTALIGLSMVAAAAAKPLPQRNAQGLLVDFTGHTLYTYDSDGASGRSQCNGPCAALWPPYLADAADRPNGDFSLTTRVDGGHQWVYQAHPLYLYAGDSRPGDKNGDGVNGTWHVVH